MADVNGDVWPDLVVYGTLFTSPVAPFAIDFGAFESEVTYRMRALDEGVVALETSFLVLVSDYLTEVFEMDTAFVSDNLQVDLNGGVVYTSFAVDVLVTDEISALDGLQVEVNLEAAFTSFVPYRFWSSVGSADFTGSKYSGPFNGPVQNFTDIVLLGLSTD